MAIAEKEIHKSLVQKFVRIIEEDKKRKVPVIKYIRPGFLLALTQRFKGNKNKINFIGITGESASGKSTFVRTITKKINKEECIINWNKSAKQIKCLILGANPDPIARTILNNDLVRIHRARISDIPGTNKEPGTILENTSAKNGVFVQCGQGVLEIIEAQLPGGKVVSAKNLVSGRKLAIGMQFMPLAFPNTAQNLTD